jgi:chromosome partitioning protein
MRITLAAMKGGPGKTTSAVHLAAAMHAAGESVLLVDADPQGSAMHWMERIDAPWWWIAMPSTSLHKQVPVQAKQLGADHVVIDSPPGDPGIVTSAMKAASVILVPVQPTSADLNQVAETLALADDVATLTEARVVVLLTRVITRTLAAREARTVLEGDGLTVLQTVAPQSQTLALSHGHPVEPGVYADVLDELKGMGA